VDAYNAATRSLDNRLLATANRFVDLGVAGMPIDPPRRVDTRSRPAGPPDHSVPAIDPLESRPDDSLSDPFGDQEPDRLSRSR